MGYVVECPITVHIYNVGAIFLLEITSVSQQMNHIDMYHHFIHDYVEDITVTPCSLTCIHTRWIMPIFKFTI